MTSKERAYLRSQANTIDATFQIGKSGITDVLLKQLDDAIEARELIKVTILDSAPASAKELAEELATGSNSVVVQTIGNKVTLFRQKKENSKYTLPK